MLTRQGWATLVASAGSFVVGRFLGVIELYVIGSALVALIALAFIAVNRRLPELEVSRAARPSTVAVGERSRVDIEVQNCSRRRSPRLALWEPVGDTGGAEMQLAPLAGGDSVTAAYRIPTMRRGRVGIGPARLQRSALLGLCRRPPRLGGSDEVLVVPERVPLAFPGLASTGRLGEHIRMRAMGRTGFEFHSQREYVPGDDLRRINWKTSARVGDLIVRETTPEGVHRCLVVLDTDPRRYDHDGFERAVSAAASVVTGAVAAGAITRLVAPGLDLRGPDVAHETLRRLATLVPSTAGLDHALAGGAHADGLGLVVVVTSTVASHAAAAASTVAGPDEVMVLITTMAPARGGTRFVAGATSLVDLEEEWNRLVSGQDGPSL